MDIGPNNIYIYIYETRRDEAERVPRAGGVPNRVVPACLPCPLDVSGALAGAVRCALSIG